MTVYFSIQDVYLKFALQGWSTSCVWICINIPITACYNCSCCCGCLHPSRRETRKFWYEWFYSPQCVHSFCGANTVQWGNSGHAALPAPCMTLKLGTCKKTIFENVLRAPQGNQASCRYTIPCRKLESWATVLKCSLLEEGRAVCSPIFPGITPCLLYTLCYWLGCNSPDSIFQVQVETVMTTLIYMDLTTSRHHLNRILVTAWVHFN